MCDRQSMFEHYFGLTGEVAVVTGGAGMLGEEYAETLFRAGASVVVVDIKDGPSERIQRLMAECVLRGEPPIRFFQVDLTQEERVRATFDAIARAAGAPTILINNAGLDSLPSDPAETNGPFENVPPDSIRRFFETHVMAATHATQAFVRHHKQARKKSGCIVNISSIYGMVAPDQRIYAFRRTRGEDFHKNAGYSIAKSAFFNLTRRLAEELSPLNIRVNTLVLGGVHRDGFDREFVSAYGERTMLGRMAEKNEYNAAMLFLVSPASSYMTGASLVVDGGWTAW